MTGTLFYCKRLSQKKIFFFMINFLVALPIYYVYKTYTINNRYSQHIQINSTIKINSTNTTSDSYTKTRSARENPGKCTKEKLLFLKTHKTGSSTLTNILNHYAERHNKRVLMPHAKNTQFNWPNYFNASGHPSADMLVNHARYHRQEMKKLFPTKETIYITILRDPVTQFESQFYYFGYPAALNIISKPDPMQFFLQNLPSVQTLRRFYAGKNQVLQLIQNPLLFDLGVHVNDLQNPQMIGRAISTLDKHFDLVLITELFDESLTLLRRRMCWKIDDVLYFVQNERLAKEKRQISNNETIRAWNFGDAALYDFFRAKLMREIKKEGSDFHHDVELLRKRRREMQKMCIAKSAVVKAYGKKMVKGFKLYVNVSSEHKQKCTRMLTNELDYLAIQRKRTSQTANFVNENVVGIDVKLPEYKVSDYKYTMLSARFNKEPKREVKNKVVEKERPKDAIGKT